MTTEPATSDDEFQLHPNEDFLFGVSMEHGTLRFGPAGGSLLWASLTSVVALIIATALLFAEFDSFKLVFWKVGPTVGKLVGFVVASAILMHLVVRLRAGTRADRKGVVVRSLLRSRRHGWSNIVGTRIIETEPVAPFRLTLADHRGGVRADVDSSKAYLVLDDESLVHLKGLDASAKASGMSGGLPTPTEIKIGVLRRYREEMVDAWPTVAGQPVVER